MPLIKGAGKVRNITTAWLRAIAKGGMLMGGMLAFAHAAPPAAPDVTIPTCNLQSGQTVVDFGAHTRAQVSSVQGGMSPGERQITVTAVCSVSQVLKLRFAGAQRNGQFAFGAAGYQKVMVMSAQVDGQPVMLALQKKGAESLGESQTSLTLEPQDVLVPVKNGEPVTGRQLMVIVAVMPVLHDEETRPAARTQTAEWLRLELVR